ncbi:hypothetical protein P389DRAFT_156288 [Cystobasidium minutum MCA 4210]|uniref:uncharacterized protein n=1 Tax=Cystobasidium minutum MCA 4210 TaxID=1397322 RepID=UPI0034CF1CA5|eukprot:jgi/Rhomi1/156288/estExt_Genewise1.C_110098
MSWKNFSANLSSLGGNLAHSVQGIDLSGTSSKLTKGLSEFQQTVKESIGRTDEDGVTELPEEYKALERRCDALKNAHQSLLRVAKVYSTEPYDYPTNINESLGEIGSNVSHSLTFWASQATKNTALPKIEPTEKVTEQKKTLPHALSRAAAGAALDLTGGSAAAASDTSATSQGDVRLGRSLQAYAVAQDKIGAARLAQDAAITNNFYKPWTSTLNNQINAAVKARQHVKSARLSLDAARAKYKHLSTGAAGASSNAQKVEQARLEVEAAEETLVTATEEAINLMRAVLDNPDSLKSLSSLVKAQQEYHAKAAEILAGITDTIEESAVAAEVDYRKSRT